jgi:hypothetical protein
MDRHLLRHSKRVLLLSARRRSRKISAHSLNLFDWRAPRIVHALEYMGHLLSIFGILSEMIELLIPAILIFVDRGALAFDVTFSHDSHDIVVIS